MKSLLRTLLTATVLLLAAAPLAAQEGELVAVDAAGTFSIELSEGAEVHPFTDFPDFYGDLNGLNGIVIVIDEVTALIVAPNELQTVIDLPAGEDADYFALLEEAFRDTYDWYPEDRVEDDTPIGDFPTARIHFEQVGEGFAFEAETALLIFDDAAGDVFLLDIVAPLGEFESVRADFEAIFATLARAETAASGGEPCSVSTGQFRSATVRVGPGEHRTALLFLEPNKGFPVEGRFVADDGTVWYRLVKDEVDPGSSAAELWVAAEGLTEVGGCATVGEAAAPPLRPIIAPRPTSVPGGGSTGGGTADTPPSTAVSPASGTWLFIYNDRVLVSCAGGGHGEFPFSELEVAPTELVTIVTAPDGNSLTLNDFFYPRINDTLFLGDETLGEYNTQVYLFPESTTRLRLEVRFNVVISGVGCSATVSGNGTRQ